jgi:hypothetical protein
MLLGKRHGPSEINGPTCAHSFVGQITQIVVVPAAFRRSDTALSERIARYRRPLLLRMPYNLAIVCTIGMLAHAVSLRIRVCYRNIQACVSKWLVFIFFRTQTRTGSSRSARRPKRCRCSSLMIAVNRSSSSAWWVVSRIFRSAPGDRQRVVGASPIR